MREAQARSIAGAPSSAGPDPQSPGEVNAEQTPRALRHGASPECVRARPSPLSLWPSVSASTVRRDTRPSSLLACLPSMDPTVSSSNSECSCAVNALERRDRPASDKGQRVATDFFSDPLSVFGLGERRFDAAVLDEARDEVPGERETQVGSEGRRGER